MRRRSVFLAPVVLGLASATRPALARAADAMGAPAAGISDRQSADVTSTPRPVIGASARVPTAIRLRRLAISAGVVELGMNESGEWQLPEEGVGWYWFTASPGTPGNAVMVGHFDTWWGGDGPLARLHEARLGDRIDLDVVTRTARPDGDVTDGPLETLTYAVATSRLVDRTDLSSTTATDDERLTLVTCAGWWSFTLNDYTMRRVVTATRTA